MSHFGRAGPPDITDTYSLLVLNITFRMSTADDLFPLFYKYGKVVDVFIPRDRRTGDSRGFAFVRYKYADETQKAVDKLDGEYCIFLIIFTICIVIQSRLCLCVTRLSPGIASRARENF
ncbi:putative RNA recognition motif domain, nucleotide-binding alpha-beta plait domain superfamily [Helianthus annuus]|nr:putative RNA recognition motif domain, nucleotide-binding alpha-beta plait domain superfamily [Helianthus annuus]KAJ0474060.1 putative RNA recognition motif domain, nucleotide-binding alpha-beta plait domain superfamily [Helianthus annuus]KAJ0649624.1 putative RNA recognition motif domain, nucleotide-binding alpha-beta plait domain superfamily [Helianthus annuus]KAJ0653415.1 putative RNA recognition motif domain, nucleotide-binding alpha-beta plait domain superfamily [Helianthus annuus]